MKDFNKNHINTIDRILDYQIIEPIYEGNRTLVYRSILTDDQLPVALKLLKNEYPTFSELVHFRNQYTIAKNLNSPLIIQTYSLEVYKNGYVLVMEDFGGISLQKWALKEQKALCSLIEFLVIAIALCNTLDLLCHERIIHKDIKPSNILINPLTKQVKLIDFSIASLLPRETQTFINPHVLEGTLAYISPEQTGRMNRGIDYRSDFYSLGVTFYELLTGELPFPSNDPMELVHCHIAKIAPLVHEINSEIPSVISKIVNKLMAKNAEDRYQSALGLKFDLENCWHQLQETGEIASFEIAQRDVCDRFLIPDKLYGREQEVQTLLEAFGRVANPPESPLSKGGHRGVELMLVAGFSGIGKTAVVNEVHKPIVRCNGYFIKGKYDQFNRNLPFSAFVQAFRDLMGQLLSESDEQLTQWKDKILLALGENAQVLIEVIPELKQIIGKQPAATELSGSAAQNRFNLLFQKFIALFATLEHPLVMFLDDLQWADSASLNLMQALMSQREAGYLFIIGAYRDNEVFPAHPLMLTLEEITKAEATLNTLTLNPLSQSDVNHLIADTLSCSRDRALPLTELVYQKTKGNPFFATQFLKALYDDKLISFNPPVSPTPLSSPLTKGGQRGVQGGWQCDVAQVRSLSLTDDVVEFMALQLQKLPAQTQTVLKLAACIGNEFDLATLAIVCEQSPIQTATVLWKALQEGLVIPQSQVYKFYLQQTTEQETAPIVFYKFLHDRVQQAAYSLIPDEDKQKTHLAIGRLLLNNTPQTEQQERIIEIVNQLNYGIAGVNDEVEQRHIARLNLLAARKAKASTAYQAAKDYLNFADRLLGESAWQTAYRLKLDLCNDQAEIAYCLADYLEVEKHVNAVLLNTNEVAEQIAVYLVRIKIYNGQTQFQKTLSTSLLILKKLGVKLPSRASKIDVLAALIRTQITLRGKSPKELLNLPEMTDLKKQYALTILHDAGTASFFVSPELCAILILKGVELCVQFGNGIGTALTYGGYGLLLCAVERYELGYRFGQLALQLADRPSEKRYAARTILVHNCMIAHWKEALRERIPSFQKGYQLALEIGDHEFAAASAYQLISFAFWCGENLVVVEETVELYQPAIDQFQQPGASILYDIVRWAVLRLLGKIEGMPRSIVSDGDRDPFRSGDGVHLASFELIMLMYACIMGQWEEAIERANNLKQYRDAIVGTYMMPIAAFYSSLALLSNCAELAPFQKQQRLKQVAIYQKKMKQWAARAPMNYGHKFHLVEAERHRVLGKWSEAIEQYDRAIALAKENGYTQEESLANELTAKFYLNWGRDWGRETVARVYMTEAYYCYSRWGAKVKIDDLEKCYPQLLQPILRSKHTDLNPLEKIPIITNPNGQNHQSTQISTFSSTSVLTALDFASILKASQALSSEIYLDKLLVTLLNTVIANAGASKCVLMLLWDGSLQVAAVTQLGQEPRVLQALAVDDSNDVPVSLIHTIKHTLQTVIIDEATKEASLFADPYIIQQQPQSLLCMPIVNQGKLLGILYLENRQTTGAFTKERVAILNLLCCQAAISLENARLYEQLKHYSHQLEIKVTERTAELEKANQELYRAATVDGLTLVANRRRFDFYLQEQWQQLLLTKQPLGLLLCDIDYFKYYNDYYGHQAGDECLKQVAQMLSLSAKRSRDLVARYGGEEFAIILPDTDMLSAKQVAERIGSNAKRLQLPHAKSPIVPYITLSVGISSIVPDPNTSWVTLISNADEALYQAKNTGRNRSCIYGHS